MTYASGTTTRGYEIPQPLKYEEKVVANLTFVQAAWLGMGALSSSVLVKSFGVTVLTAPLCILIMLLVGGFAFFKLGDKLLAVAGFYWHPRRIGYLDDRMGALIGVSSVDDDVLRMRGGGAYAVVQVMPINFMIKSEDDKSAIIGSFQKFLNSLDFSIQVLARTVNLNLDSYMESLKAIVGEKIERTKNEKLQRLFDDYCEFVQERVVSTAVKDRLFYLVVPAPRDSADADEILCTRVEQCMEGLASCGLRTRRLNSMQIVSLLASFFEGYVEVDNDYLFPVTMLDRFAGEAR